MANNHTDNLLVDVTAERRIVQRNVLLRSLLVRSQEFFVQLLTDNIRSLNDEHMLEMGEIVAGAKRLGADAVCKRDALDPSVTFTLRDITDPPDGADWVDLLRDIHAALERSP